MQVRLNKFLADAGIASRRRADELIQNGLIKINGEIAKVGDKVDLDNDKVEYQNKLINNSSRNLVYYALNKPIHVLSTVSDDRSRETVLDFIPSSQRIYPIGRLDYNSSGLILLTNDGDLTLKLTHPRYHLPKTYLVELRNTPTPQQLHQLSSGVDIGIGKTTKSDVEIFHTDQKHTNLKITLYQGLNRQIRRMCEALDLRIISLHRIAIGPIQLANLKTGEYRQLTQNEISSLKNS